MAIDFRLPRIGPRAATRWPAPLAVARFLREPVPHLLAWRGRGAVVPVADRNAALVLIFGADGLRELLTDRDTWQRPDGALVQFPAEYPHLANLGRTLILLNGQEHQRRRRLALPAIHRTEALAAFQTEMARTVSAAADEMKLGLHDVAALGRRIALRNNLRCLLGMEDPREGERFAAAAHVFSKRLMSPATALSQWAARQLRRGRPIPGTPYARWIAAGEQIHGAFVELLRQRRAAPGADVLSALLNATDETTGQPVPEHDLVGEVLGLYGAGYETTAYTLAWTLILLATHPREASAVREELQAVLGGRAATLDDMPRLPLLNAAIQESQRVLTVVPISLPRVAAQSTSLLGISLPAGTLAAGALLASHHNPDVFREPHRYRPSRWETLDPAHLPYDYLPYGVGARRCLGAAFADLQLRVTLSVLLQRFAFEVEPTKNRFDYKTVQVTMGTRGPAYLIAREATRGVPRVSGVRGNLRELVDFPTS